MKVILMGYEGSKKILPASSYLIRKYLKGDFDIYFLNYGEYDGELFTGQYVSLKDEQKNGAGQWAPDLIEYLEKLEDEHIIFALDDYLLAGFDKELYDSIETAGYDSIKLCKEATLEREYSCTTQYTIWRRSLLIDILKRVRTPWQFEEWGSVILNGYFKSLDLVKCLDYPSNSCLSEKWTGVKTKGNEHDLEEIKHLL